MSTRTLLRAVDSPEDQNLLLGVFDPECPDFDPYDENLLRAGEVLERLSRALTAKQRNICSAYLKGGNLSEIAREAGSSPPTVKKHLANDLCQRYIAYVQYVQRVQNGPSEERRIDLLWRIARNNQHSNPRVSIAAVDTINKTMGVYRPEDTSQDGQVTIKINNFTLNSPGEPQKPEAHDAEPVVLDGEFTPVTVNTDDA